MSRIRYEVAPVLETDWREDIRGAVEGESIQTLYRWTNAGTVANIIGETGTLGLVGNLAPLYRLDSPASSRDEDREAAESLIREVWNEKWSRRRTSAVDDVTERAEKVAPTKRSGGGGGGGSDSDDDDGDDDGDDGDGESRRESDEDFAKVNAETVANVAANIAAFVNKAEKDYGVKPEVSRAIIAWTALLAKENTTPNHNGGDAIAAALA